MDRAGGAERAFAFACLALFAALAITSMRVKSPTFDETAHLAAGISYVQTHDFRMNPEHPALPKMLAGWAASAVGAHADTATAAWRRGDQWEFARETLYGGGPPWRRVLFAGRLPMVAIGVLLGLVLWSWTRRMVGSAGAAVTLVLFTFSPTFLAHARLVTTDVPLTFTVVSTCACLWAAHVTGRYRWILAASCFVGLSMLAKFSAFSYVPVYAVLAILPSDHRSFRKGLAHGALLAVVAFAITELLVASSYGFAGELVTIRSLGMEGRGVQLDSMSPLRRIPFETVASVPWPSREFAQGLKDVVLYTEAGHPVYALGMRSDRGWWWAPLLMLAVKLPLPLLVLGSIGAVTSIVRRSLRSRQLLFVLLPAALVVATNLAANLGLGVRHLAPAIPSLMIAAAWPLRGSGIARRSPAMVAMVALLVAQAVGVLRAHPHYLPYFHALAGGPRGGARLLGDSNLDWGQDLSLAAAWLRDHGVDGAVLSYFGTADPFAEPGITWQLLPPTARAKEEDPWTTLAPRGPEWLVMSVTNLQGVYSRLEGRDVPYPWLSNVEPDAIIGGSIYLYEIGDAPEIQRGLASAYRRYGMPDEFENARLRSGDVTADELTAFARRRRNAGDLAGAVDMYEAGVHAFPNDPELHNDYAWSLQEAQRDLSAALEHADQAVKLEPGDFAYRDTRGMVRWRLGNAREALADFDAALALPGGDVPEIRWHRARALADAGRARDAQSEAARLLELDDLPRGVHDEIADWIAKH